MIEGLSHVTFVVSDLKRMTSFLSTIFGAEEIYDSGNKKFSFSREKYFKIGDIWIAIMEGESLKEETYNHIAFKIPEAEFDEYVARVHTIGVKIRQDRNRVDGEGRSLYFFDYDNHLFELHTGTVGERLNRYKGER